MFCLWKFVVMIFITRDTKKETNDLINVHMEILAFDIWNHYISCSKGSLGLYSSEDNSWLGLEKHLKCLIDQAGTGWYIMKVNEIINLTNFLQSTLILTTSQTLKVSPWNFLVLANRKSTFVTGIRPGTRPSIVYYTLKTLKNI